MNFGDVSGPSSYRVSFRNENFSGGGGQFRSARRATLTKTLKTGAAKSCNPGRPGCLRLTEIPCFGNLVHIHTKDPIFCTKQDRPKLTSLAARDQLSNQRSLRPHPKSGLFKWVMLTVEHFSCPEASPLRRRPVVAPRAQKFGFIFYLLSEGFPQTRPASLA